MSPKSNRGWLKEHFLDPYVKKAHEAGYRSRAVYKLLEIHDRDHLFRPGMLIIDLGAAPGGWSQLVSKLVRPDGKVIAIDILPMEAIPGVHFLQGDFTEESILQQLLLQLDKNKADWIISDLAPNLSGNASVDIPRALGLAEAALDLALKALKPSGGLLIKMFQGEGFDDLFAKIKRNFRVAALRKPKASKGKSRELYILAKGLKK